MKSLSVFLAALLAISPFAVFADPPAGAGHGKSGFDSIIGGSGPPGLQGKSYPRGLSKQGKIPHGWSKGKKKGWYKMHHHWYYFDGYNLIPGHHGD